MRKSKTILLAAVLSLLMPPAAQAQASSNAMPAFRGLPQAPAVRVLTLQQLEQMALQNNPTLGQAAAATRSARGLARQAGLMPNPVVGFQAEEFAFRQLNAKPEYFGFFEQTLPLGGKLAKSRRIYLSQAAQAEAEATAQRQRVINAVRTLFYRTLGAQQQVDLRSQLADIARQATRTTCDLFNVGQADKPDYLAAEIETSQIEHELQTARNELIQAWKLLSAFVGMPEMTPVRLEGTLEDQIPPFNEDQLLSALMQESPQIKSAQAQVCRARAVLVRAKAEPIPDMYVRGGTGYSSEYLENRRGNVLGRTGVEANMQLGVSLPLWNRNQGGIAAAQAELAFAEAELTRVRLSLRVRFAEAIKNYNNAVDAVRRYRDVMLPRADEAYQLYLAKYKQMSASYPQVLISQRTMFQLRQQYIAALVDLQQNAASLQGYLLTGGLDAPNWQPATNTQRVEMTGVGAGSQGSDQHALDTAGLVEY